MDENTPVRYTVYCSLIKVAATCNAIAFIPTDLDQVEQHGLRKHVWADGKNDDLRLYCSLGA